jgi:hypothetical protein
MTDTMSQGTSRVTGSTGDAARDVAGNATQAAGDVAGTARQQAGLVAGEAVNQAQQLIGQAQQELNEQATQQTQRLATNIRELARHFASMADSGRPGSPAETVVRRLAESSDRVARYLEGKQPGDMVTDIQQLGRRRPGEFLLGAALAGVAVGRLGNAARKSSTSDTPDRSKDLPPTTLPSAGAREVVQPPVTGAATVEHVAAHDPYPTMGGAV